MLAFALGLTAMPTHAQNDGYYRQDVNVSTSKMGTLSKPVDAIDKVRIIKADDWQQMTITEYLRYNTSLGIDSVNAYVQDEMGFGSGAWKNQVLNGLDTTSTFWVPTNKAWIETKPKWALYHNYVEKVSYMYWKDTQTNGTGWSLPTNYTDSLSSESFLELGLTTPAPQPVLLHQQVLNGEVSVVDSIPFEYLVPELSTQFNVSSI